MYVIYFRIYILFYIKYGDDTESIFNLFTFKTDLHLIYSMITV